MSRKLGAKAENIARRFLLEKGYTYIDSNFYSPVGEIDLIFKDEDQLVFVEVKARYSSKYGPPQEAVNQAKYYRIFRTSEYFMQQHPKLPQGGRIDIISILLNDPPQIDHLENIML